MAEKSKIISQLGKLFSMRWVCLQSGMVVLPFSCVKKNYETLIRDATKAGLLESYYIYADAIGAEIDLSYIKLDSSNKIRKISANDYGFCFVANKELENYIKQNKLCTKIANLSIFEASLANINF